jgi:acyl-CoA synthetase (NDP forming)
VYPFPEEALVSLYRAAWYAQGRTTARAAAPLPDGIRRYEAAAVIAQALARDRVWLDPGELEALCACYGIPLAESRVAHGIEAAVRAAQESTAPSP